MSLTTEKRPENITDPWFEKSKVFIEIVATPVIKASRTQFKEMVAPAP